MAVVEYGPRMTGGVKELQYVHGTPDGLGALGAPDLTDWLEGSKLGLAVRNGLLVMGGAAFLGLGNSTSRLLGIVSFGLSLVR